MNLGQRFEVKILAERMFQHRLNLPVPAPDGGWLVSFMDEPEVILLDARLNELQRLDLQAQSEEYCFTEIAISRSGQWIALSGRTDLRMADRTGVAHYRIPHVAWGSFAGSSCFFDREDRLWYVRPGDQPGSNDHLVLIEPESGETLFEQKIENEIGHFHLFPCPDQESALIDVGCGQDGSFLYLARLTEAGLTIQQYAFDDRTFYGNFSPDGSEFATGAHGGDAVKVHAFPSGQVVASLSSKTVFAKDTLQGDDPDSIGYQVIFLDADHLLATTGFGRMLLLHRQGLRLLGTVWPKGERFQGYDLSGHETDDPEQIENYETGLESLHPAGTGKVLTLYDGNVLRLLDISPLLAPE